MQNKSLEIQIGAKEDEIENICQIHLKELDEKKININSMEQQ